MPIDQFFSVFSLIQLAIGLGDFLFTILVMPDTTLVAQSKAKDQTDPAEILVTGGIRLD